MLAGAGAALRGHQQHLDLGHVLLQQPHLPLQALHLLKSTKTSGPSGLPEPAGPELPGTYADGLLQLGQRSREAVLDLAHPAVGAVQLVLEIRNVANLRHFLQNRAEALQSGPDLSRVVQNALKGQRNRRVITAPGWALKKKKKKKSAIAPWRPTVEGQAWGCWFDTDLQRQGPAAQTLGAGVGAGRRQPGLGPPHPGLSTADHLLVLLQPRLHLSRKNKNTSINIHKYKYKYTYIYINIQIQIYIYKYTNINIQI